MVASTLAVGETRWQTEYGLVRLCVRESGDFAVSCPNTSTVLETESMVRNWAIRTRTRMRWDSGWMPLNGVLARVGIAEAIQIPGKVAQAAEKERRMRAEMAERRGAKAARKQAKKQRRKKGKWKQPKAPRPAPPAALPTESPQKAEQRRAGERIRVYGARNSLIQKLGYATYAEYLSSPLWGKIRAAVLARDGSRCRACGARACQVHHLDYAHPTMTGESITQLRSVCRECHEEAEILPDGNKASPKEANAHLQNIAMLGRVARVKLRKQRRAGLRKQFATV